MTIASLSHRASTVVRSRWRDATRRAGPSASAESLSRDAMLARCMLSSCVRPSVCPSVASRCCIETTGRMEPVFSTEASFHLSCTVKRKFGYVQKLVYFPSGTSLCPKLRSLKISPRQVDRVVNKTRRRRRRRSSLLTTPVRQSTSRGCLLQVGQL